MGVPTCTDGMLVESFVGWINQAVKLSIPTSIATIFLRVPRRLYCTVHWQASALGPRHFIRQDQTFLQHFYFVTSSSVQNAKLFDRKLHIYRAKRSVDLNVAQLVYFFSSQRDLAKQDYQANAKKKRAKQTKTTRNNVLLRDSSLFTQQKNGNKFA